ncbi:ATP-dependent bile acid permease [Mycena kentingensis (nom. inval.)]|nr:ATP-dependent bile acid permease [Mycena kentingensis (nom. inval.)]
MSPCGQQTSAFDLGDACIRSWWGAFVPFSITALLCILAIPIPVPRALRVPFTKFLTLHEAEAIQADAQSASDNDLAAPTAPTPLWRARVFAFVGIIQFLAWTALAVAGALHQTADSWGLTRLGLVASTWLYTAVRSVVSPPTTAPFDLFALYVAHVCGAVLVIGGYLFEYAVGDQDVPLPPRYLLVASSIYFAIVLVLLSLATGIPMALPSARIKKEDIGNSVSPEDYTTLYQWITFSWMYPLVKKGTRQTLDEDDVWAMSPTMQSRPVFLKFQSIVRKTLLRRIVVANSFDMLIDFIGTIGSIFFQYAGPYLLKNLLELLDLPNPTPRDKGLAHMYAAMMFFCAIMRGQCNLQHLWFSRRSTARVRSELMAAVYDKALKRKDFSGAVKEKEKSTAEGDQDKPQEENKEKSSADVGKIVNMLSSDAEDISFIASSIYFLYGAPFEIAIGSVFLYQLLGWSAFTGFIALFAVMPFNRYLTQISVKLYEATKKAADKRMALVDELIAAVKFIKFFGGEQKWADRVMEARGAEIKLMERNRFYNILFNLVWGIGPLAHSLVSFAVYVMLGNQLTVSKAFTARCLAALAACSLILLQALAIFSSIRMPLNIVPTYIVHLLRSKVALDRIASFLQEEEVSEQVSSIKQDALTVPHEGLGLENATLEWNHAQAEEKTQETDVQATSPSPSESEVAAGTDSVSTIADSETVTTADRDHHFELKNISVLFPEGKLSLVTGPTASGKTALLMALMGEMTLLPTGGRIIMGKDTSVDENGYTHGIAYAAQSPWLQHRSIKDNILFGSSLEEERYKEVVKCCALKPDFDMLEDGDQTEIGVKGVSLSGGQKARVALARAVYSRKKYLLLDDPLSAVDSHTSRFLYENCLQGPLVANRTVILVTHHVELVIPAAHYLVRMLDGRIDTQGTIGELRAQGVLEEIKHDAAVEVEKEEQAAVAPDAPVEEAVAAETKKPRKLVEDEHREVGSVKWSVYNAYLVASGYWIWAILVLFAISQNLRRIGEKLWFKTWAESYGSPSNMHIVASASAYDGASQVFLVPFSSAPGDVFDANELPDATQHPLFYIGVYTVIAVSGLLLSITGTYVQLTGALRASRVLFQKLLFSVVRATFRFHDTTPQGRMLNRFSKDFATVDGDLSFSLDAVTTSLSGFFVSIITVAVVFPPFIFPGIIISGLYWSLAHSYLAAGRDFKRMESNNRSPIFSDFGELLNGIVTVRAFSAEKRFMEGLHTRTDSMAKQWYAFWMGNRWLLVNFDVLGGASVYVTALFAIIALKNNAGIAGLAITSALSFSDAVYWTCRFHAELELNLNSVERITEYLELPQEPPAIIESNRPPAYWPSSTANDSLVVVEDLDIKYAPDLPSVLQGVSFKLKAGERVGLVGRTGSGKSTLAMSLLRFVDPSSGKIVVDGIDICKIGLHDLRSRMTFIPQDATLFSGTLRDNLDPFNEHEDSVCLDVLQRVHLIAFSQVQSRVPTPGTSRAASVHQGDSDASVDADDALSTAPTNVDTKTTLSLDTQVSAGGSNFSAGQRQLIAMARALLRRSSIVIMDEATSSVDMETDAKIQHTIREEFAGSLLITVAHRLKTIIDYDRVMVLDKGKVVEFHSPLELMRQDGSVFRGMCMKSGAFTELEAMAEAARSP